MKSRRVVPFVFFAAFLLNACSPVSSPHITPATDKSAVSANLVGIASGKPGPALYVLNSANGKSFSISVYIGGGASLLRSIPIGLSSDGFTVSGPRLYFGYPTKPGSPEGAGSLGIYSSRGTKLVRTLTQKKPFGLLTLDSAGNLFTLCRPNEACEYADAKQHIVRKIAFTQLGLTVFGMTTDPAGDLAAWGEQSVLVFAPGHATPYWTINKYGVVSAEFDSSGNLYVGTCCNPTNIEIFPPGAQSPTRTIATGITDPLFTTFDAAGNLYVLNRGVVQNGECSQPTEVTVYSPGASTPSRTVSSGLQCDASRVLALDSAGDIYVPNEYATGNPTGNVVVYGPHSDSPSRTITKSIANPTSLRIGP